MNLALPAFPLTSFSVLLSCLGLGVQVRRNGAAEAAAHWSWPRNINGLQAVKTRMIARSLRRKRNVDTSQAIAHGNGGGRRRVYDLPRLRPGPAVEEEGLLQGRLRPDREQQPVAPGADGQHEGRGQEARRSARLYRRRRLGRQAGRRR